MTAKRIEFPAPQGLTLPEGLKAGDTFDKLSTFRLKPNGSMCLVKIGDTPMPGYGDKNTAYKDIAKEAGESVAAKYKEKMAGPSEGETGGSDTGGGY